MEIRNASRGKMKIDFTLEAVKEDSVLLLREPSIGNFMFLNVE